MRSPNIGVAHGIWGEDIAVERLRAEGYVVVDRNVHPCAWDARLEIDIIAFDREADTMVFVEVKQHKTHACGESRMRSIDTRKLRNLRIACNAWRRRNRWTGGYRFDVVEVFGTPENRQRVEIDHIRRVKLFTEPSRFVNWDY